MPRAKEIRQRFPVAPPQPTCGTRYRKWLESQVELFKMTLNGVADAVMVTMPSGEMTGLNPAAEKLIGKTDAELANVNLLQCFRMVDGECLGSQILELIHTRNELHYEPAYLRHASGELIPVDLHVAALKIDGVIVRIAATCRDLRRESEHQRELERQAKTDRLTGCYNRWWLDEEYPKLETQARKSGEYLGFAFIDLDRFKIINDESYALGDELIRLAAQTIRKALRPTDNLVRLGGDEFVLPLAGLDLEHAEQICRRILEAFPRLVIKMPRSPNARFVLTASIGLSVMQGSDPRLCDLMHEAQEAKRLAKEGGRNCICIQPDDDVERPSVH